MKRSSQRDRPRSARSVGALIVVGAVALALAGCSSSSSGSGSASTKSGSVPSLTVAMAQVDPTLTVGFLAEALGYFKQEHVNVTLIPNAGANVTNYVVAGQADLGWSAAATAATIAMQGKDIKTVYAPNGNAPSGVLVGAPGITSVAQLNGKKVGVVGPGSTTWGYASIYASNAKVKVDLVPLGGLPAITAAVSSGQVQGGVGTYASFSSLIKAGKANLLVDTRSAADRKKYLGPDFPDGAVFGMTSDIATKRVAIVRFLAALDKADAYAKSHTDAQLATKLLTLKDWQIFTQAQLTQLESYARVYWSPNGGEISKSVYKTVLDKMNSFDIPNYSSSLPVLAYSKRVDMSLLKDAGK
jgi:ABC-type nitrate/sulfonate/bicarbonate transport system substrate-binding protein